MLCVLKDEQRTWSFESETGAGVIRAARRSTRRDMAIRNRLVCDAKVASSQNEKQIGCVLSKAYHDSCATRWMSYAGTEEC